LIFQLFKQFLKIDFSCLIVSKTVSKDEQKIKLCSFSWKSYIFGFIIILSLSKRKRTSHP